MGVVSSGAVTSRKEWHLDPGWWQRRSERNLQEIIRTSDLQDLLISWMRVAETRGALRVSSLCKRKYLEKENGGRGQD